MFIIMITLYSIVLTVLIYFFTRFLSARYHTPLTNPVFLSTVLIIPILFLSHVSYIDYTLAKTIMTYLLGPATVALALPIYKNRQLIGKYIYAAVVGLILGSLATIAAAILLGKVLHLARAVILSFSVKSVTVPVAAEIGKILKGDISLIAGMVIITGMIGAMFGPKFLSFIGVHHPFARGLSIGTIAHGIGTAEAVKEGEVQGAVAGAAMGIAAVMTSFVIPFLVPFIL